MIEENAHWLFIAIVVILFIIWKLSKREEHTSKHTITNYRGFKIKRTIKSGFTVVLNKKGKTVRTLHTETLDRAYAYLDNLLKNVKKTS